MTHYHLTNKETGEECIVTSLKGHPSKLWRKKSLAHAPKPHDKFVNGKVFVDAEAKARNDTDTEATLMGVGGLLARIKTIEDRLARLEKGEGK